MTSSELFPADRRSALVLLHLQNEVLDPDGIVGRRGIAAVAESSGVVEAVLRAMSAARAAGVPIIHVVLVGREGTCTSTALNLRAGVVEGFQPHSWGVRVVARLAADDAIVIEHDTMSGFAGTDLAPMLLGRGIDRVLLGGVSVHLVVAATAFAAADLGLDVVLLRDCCAAPNERTSDAAFAQLSAVGKVMSTLET
ncbi:cysteine hydrolase family protein [uncultured Amnibacterium sp.]|uniref:cysteine hydrolase family protein n=1 Tax=uncultured Amnibacterium sp. TaxID=1631851 RepID=UPI0035CA424E